MIKSEAGCRADQVPGEKDEGFGGRTGTGLVNKGEGLWGQARRGPNH